MPRSKNNFKRSLLDRNILENAIKLIKEKKFTLYGASKHFNISRSTLRRYYNNVSDEGVMTDLHKNLSVKKVFNENQEKLLVQYIKEAANLQFGLTLKDVQILAYQFAKSNGIKYPTEWDSNKMAGMFWLRLFRKRFKDELSLRKPEATSLARSSAFNKHTVKLTFENYKKALSQCPSDLQAAHIWNIDETGLSTVHVPPKILAPIGVKQVGSVTSAERGNTVTLIAACNAGGGFIPPMLIFPRVNFKDFMINGAPDGTLGAANPSGWSNENTFVMFIKHFIKFVRPTKEQPVIVLMDNHESHISIPAIRLAKDNGVILVTLHPHTSNKMQPLDKTVFGPFKTYFNQATNEKMLTPGYIGKPLTIYDIAALVGKAFPRAFTPTNISNGFRVTGFHPFNENIFTDADFMPAAFLDRQPPEDFLKGDHSHPKERIAEDGSRLTQDLALQTENLQLPKDATNKSVTPQKPGPSSTNMITPEMIRPHPKAAPRQGTQKGRQRGKSRILTDTPEKTEIELSKSAKKVIYMLKDRKNKDKVKKKVLIQSDSEESTSNYSIHDTDDSCEDSNTINNFNYEVGDFVIFLYEEECFVGQIESLNEDGVLIKSMQKSLKNWKWPDKEDLNLYPYQDIKEKIEKPKRINTKREVYYVPEIAKYWDFC